MMTVQEIYDALTEDTTAAAPVTVVTFDTLLKEADAARKLTNRRTNIVTTEISGSVFQIQLSRGIYGNASMICYVGVAGDKTKRVARALFEAKLAEAQGLTAPAGKKSSNTTCQICARGIEMVGGLLAHHGYTRPGDGYQTASCPGARELPYQLSCDLIPPVILSYDAHAVGLRKLAINHIYECPPIKVPDFKKRSFQTGRTIYIPQPDILVGTTTQYGRATYPEAQRQYLAQIAQNVSLFEYNIAFLGKRVKDWKKKEVLI